mmetsp:Transcript_26029/g.59999  ORF Transcript_26029/g.59999 Transcript_26029/m.59999 type:complete len:258 (-) Transcript_26029:47-820(-)
MSRLQVQCGEPVELLHTPPVSGQKFAAHHQLCLSILADREDAGSNTETPETARNQATSPPSLSLNRDLFDDFEMIQSSPESQSSQWTSQQREEDAPVVALGPFFTPRKPESVAIFDLDGTLVGKKRLCTIEVKEGLCRLASRGVSLALASFRCDALEVLATNDILNYFDVVVSQGGPFASKPECVDAVLSAYCPDWSTVAHDGPSVSFYDDCPYNVREVREAHPEINCVHVPSPSLLLDLIENLGKRPSLLCDGRAC